MADNKYAAYICSGCGIGDAMKVPQLEAIAKKEGKMALVKSHPFLCNAEGVQTIKVGGKSKLVCPSNLAYGSRGIPGTIPPDSPLVFEVELLEILK